MTDLCKKISDRWHKHPARLLAGFYAAAAALILLGTALLWLGGVVGIWPQRALTLQDFDRCTDLEMTGRDSFITASYDPQMVYTGHVRSLRIRCRYTGEPGELVAYYAADTNESFRGDKPVYAQKRGDWYVFTFPLWTQQIRLDPAAYPSVEVQIDEMEINPPALPNTGTLFYLLVLPPLAALLAVTVCDLAAKRE